MATDARTERERIATAAHALILDRGLHRTKIEAICRAAWVPQSAFARCFGTKQRLVEALLERCREERAALCDETIWLDNDHPVDRVHAVIDRAIEAARAPASHDRGIASRLAWELDPPDRRTVGSSMTFPTGGLTNYIEDAIRATRGGRLPVVRRHAESLSLQFVAILEGARLIAMTSGYDDAVERCLVCFKGQLELLFGESWPDRTTDDEG